MTGIHGHNIVQYGCAEEKPKPSGIVIFGASGDLAGRKLIPALFNLYERDLLPDAFFVIGCGRSRMSDEDFRGRVRESVTKAVSAPPRDVESFSGLFHYRSGGYRDTRLYASLLERIESLGRETKAGSMIFYLSIPPSLYASVVGMLGSSGIVSTLEGRGIDVRVVIEKPFGFDLESALELDGEIHRVLTEDQIYRIDHYLGKETVQNILMFRFANAVFEPIWNRRYIDNVQITVAESIGVEHRAGYYEQAGLLRDMFQNHMLQMLSLVAMEPPASFDADRVRDEKVKLLRAVRPFPLKELGRWMVRGQYGPSVSGGTRLPGYREEEGVAPDSRVETFVAAKLMIDNWRWQGVPFYLRSGKRLPGRMSEIAIVFKEVPHSMFKEFSPSDLARNVLFLNVQPDEGGALHILAKGPGQKLCLSSLSLEFRYREVFGFDPPDAYERLLLDCMHGDQTLFIRHDDMAEAWSLITPVLRAWREEPQECPLYVYPSATWGPRESMDLLGRDGRYWHLSDRALRRSGSERRPLSGL